MNNVTKAQAHSMKSLGASYLEKYTNRLDSRTFAEWIDEEFASLKFQTDSDVQTVTNRYDTIQDMLTYGLVINREKGIILGSDGKQHDAHDLYEEKNLLITNMEDATQNAFTKQMGMYMCAKTKLESRSLLSKIFHPFRTYNEWNILSNLKRSISANFNIGDATFDKIVDMAEDKPAYQNIGAVNPKNGSLILEDNWLEEPEKKEIDDYIANEKKIDDDELKIEEEVAKTVPVFDDNEIIKTYDNETEEKYIEIDDISRDEFLSGLQEELKNHDDKTLSQINTIQENSIDDPIIKIK